MSSFDQIGVVKVPFAAGWTSSCVWTIMPVPKTFGTKPEKLRSLKRTKELPWTPVVPTVWLVPLTVTGVGTAKADAQRRSETRIRRNMVFVYCNRHAMMAGYFVGLVGAS